MKVLSKRDGELLSHFDNINENDVPVLERVVDLQPQKRHTCQQKMLLNNYSEANNGK